MRRKLACILAGVMLTACLPLQAMAIEFSDAVGHWAYNAVDRWSDYGVLQGYRGMFKPDSSMTRAEMSTMLVNLLGLTETEDENGDEPEFEDMDDGEWYDDAIFMCAAAGLLKGDPFGNANPNKAITREESAVILARALGIDPLYGSLPFSDSDDIGTWASGYVKAMTDRGILNGTGHGFSPQSPITRAEVATILNKAISNYANEDGESIEATGSGMTVIAAKDVTLTGTLRDGLLATAAANGGKITLKDATVNGTVTLHSGANLVVSGDTALETVIIDKEAENASVTVQEDASVASIETYAPNVKISGEGTVKNVAANGKDTAITTAGTKVVANAAGVTYNGIVVSVNTNNTASISNISAAPLVDGNGVYDMDEIIKEYTVTPSQSDSENFVRVVVKGKDLEYHYNKVESELGYWCGVALPAPANASPRYTRFNIADEDDDDAKKSTDGFHEAKKNINDTSWSTITDQDGKSIPGDFLRFYFDRAEYTDKIYLTVNWRDSEYSSISTVKYLIDVSGVSIVSYTPTFKVSLDSNIVSDNSLNYRQLATTLGVTANFSGTTLTVSGKTSLERLRRSNGNVANGNGYILVAVNYKDEDVYSVQATNNKDTLTTYRTTNYGSRDSSLTNAVLLPVRFFIGERDGNSTFADGDKYTITLYNKDKKEIGKTVITVKAKDCTYDEKRTSISINTQPQDSEITYGNTANVSVTATASPAGTLTYQWYVDGRAISGATSASYTIPTTYLSVGTHRVYCVIESPDRSMDSSTATITVKAKDATAPTVTVTSSSSEVNVGHSVVLNATATASSKTATVRYQWYMDGTAISGSNTSGDLTYTIPTSTTYGDHSFRCVVTVTDAGTATTTGEGVTTVKVLAPIPDLEIPTVSAAPSTFTNTGGAVALSCTNIKDTNGIDQSSNVEYEWTCSDTSITLTGSGAAVSATLPENTGTADATYTFTCTVTGNGTNVAGTKAASCTVTVSAPSAPPDVTPPAP